MVSVASAITTSFKDWRSGLTDSKKKVKPDNVSSEFGLHDLILGNDSEVQTSLES